MSDSSAIQLGAFELAWPIGRGGMGEVWLGRHRRLDMPVAVKVVTGRRAQKASYREGFRREVQAVAALDHPGIVTIFDFGTIDAAAEEASRGRLRAGNPYYVMEYVRGGSLAAFEAPEDWDTLQRWLLEALDALSHAHSRGIIHRDIKPANILVAGDDSRASIKVSDFGIAHLGNLAESGDIDARQSTAGTPHYMPPEQSQGHWRDYGPWTDLYALGCVAFELVSGAPPFTADHPIKVALKHLSASVPVLEPRFAVPTGFEQWLGRLLAKAPAGRFEFCADAAWHLASLDEEALEPPEPGAPSQRIPIAADWRRQASTERPTALVGAGLGLYGLREPPFVDRDEVRDALWDALRQVGADRRAQVRIVRGAAGTGKSRLVEWISQRAHELGAASVIEVRHSPITGPSHGLGAAFGRVFRCTDLARDEMLERIEAKLIELAPELYDVDEISTLDAPALAELIASGRDEADAEQRPLVQFSSPIDRFAPMLRALELMGWSRPVIVWVDDAHWGQEALEFVGHVLDAQSQRPCPVLFLLTAQEEALAEEPAAQKLIADLNAHPGAKELALGPLESADHHELLERLLTLEPALADEVSRRTDGNPMFAIQLIGDWVDRGVLEDAEAGFALRAGADAPLPDDLLQLWHERIERALDAAIDPEKARRTLEAAAALGQDVDDREWQSACEALDIEPADEVVERMITLRLACRSDHGWSFVHGMLRESLERRARRQGRWRSCHRACAELLEPRTHRFAPSVSERRAHHLVEAGEFDVAIDAFLLAAYANMLPGDFDKSHRFLEACDELVRRIELDGGDARRGWVLVRRAMVHRCQGHYADAGRFAERALNAAVSHDWHEVRLHARAELATIDMQQGRVEQAIPALEEVIDELGARGLDDERSPLFQRLGHAYVRRGDTARAQQALEEGCRLNRELGNAPTLGWCLYTLGYLNHRRGDCDTAFELFDEAQEIFEQTGDRAGILECVNGRAEIDRQLGRYERAEEAYRRAYNVWMRLGSAAGYAAQLNLGLTQLSRGAFAEARGTLTEAGARFEQLGRIFELICTEAALAAVCAAEAAVDEFDEHFEKVVDLLGEVAQVDPDVAGPLEAAGGFLVELGEDARARSALELAQDQWGRLGRPERARSTEALLSKLHSD